MFTARRVSRSRPLLSPLFEPMGMMPPIGIAMGGFPGFPGFGMIEQELREMEALFDGLEDLHGLPSTTATPMPQSSRNVSSNSVTTPTRTCGWPTVHMQTSISSPLSGPRRRPLHREAYSSSLFPSLSLFDSEDEEDDDFPLFQQPQATRSSIHSPTSHAEDMMAAMAALAEDFAGMSMLLSLMGSFGPSFTSRNSHELGPTAIQAPQAMTAGRARGTSHFGGSRGSDEGEEAVQEMSCRVVNKDPGHRCPVCLEDVEVNEPVRALVCGHTIHHPCLKRVFQGKIERDGPTDVGWQCIVCRHALK